MWPAPALALGDRRAGRLGRTRRRSLAAAPVLLAWLVSPVVAYWVSRPGQDGRGAADRRRARRAAADRAEDLALLRDVRRRRRPLAPARQLPGGAATAGSPTGPRRRTRACCCSRPSPPTTSATSASATLVDRLEKTFDTLDGAGAAPGPLLQLVRHRDARAAAAGLRLDGRQRQPARLPGGAEAGLPRAGRASRSSGRRSAKGLADIGRPGAGVAPRGEGRAVGAEGASRRWRPALLERRGRSSTSGRRTDRRRLGRVARLARVGRDASALGRARAMPDGDADRRRRARLLAPGVRGRACASTAPTSRSLARRRVGADLPSLRGLARRVAGGGRPAGAAPPARRPRRRVRRGDGLPFLYKDDRHLFSIGYNLAHGRLDASCYDLLASEACLTSFLAVARGEVPRRHWFQLGRPFIAGRRPDRPDLLGRHDVRVPDAPAAAAGACPARCSTEAAATAVARQIEYGRQTGVPWGISESAFARSIADGDYQYQSFGVPGLGLKRGLEQRPGRRALRHGAGRRWSRPARPWRTSAGSRRGRRGAVTASTRRSTTRPSACPRRSGRVVVRSYMAHHQGMSLVALANALLDDADAAPVPRRADGPGRRAAAPGAGPARRADRSSRRDADETPDLTPDADGGRAAAPADEPAAHARPPRPSPRTHLLSNGQYHVMLTNAGVGLQHLPRARRDPLARGRARATPGASSSTSATSHAAPSGRPATSRSAGRPTTTRSIFSADKADLPPPRRRRSRR